MHRFVWDLRYADMRDNTRDHEFNDEGGPRWRGPLVLPGTYKIKLTVNGRELVQALEVVMDPRSRATPADLAQQFRWAQRAFEDLIRATDALAEVDSLKKHLGDMQPQLEEKQKASLDAVSEGLHSARTGLTAALNALESADRTPPSQVIALYLESAKTLKSKLSDWEALKRATVPGRA